MPGVGIVIPDLRGIAELKPLRIHVLTTFTSTGQQFVRTDLCPNNKVWYITFSSVGFNLGDVSDCLYAIEDSADKRLAILSMWPDLAMAKTENLFGAFWLLPGQKLSARFNVERTNATCWITAMGIEFSFSG